VESILLSPILPVYNQPTTLTPYSPIHKSKDTMARRNASYSTQSHLHKSVADLAEEYTNLTFTFRQGDTDRRATDVWNTSVMGKFTCSNESCRKSGWSSKKIAIRIRMYPGRQYNARVYHQRCKKCERLGELDLDNSYAERVVYWLMK
jgi:hypothetical protein